MRLIVTYGQRWDSQNYADWLALFHPDAVFETEGSKPPNAEALHRSVAREQRSTSLTQHVCFDHQFEVPDSNRPSATCTFMLFRSKTAQGCELPPRARPEWVA